MHSDNSLFAPHVQTPTTLMQDYGLMATGHMVPRHADSVERWGTGDFSIPVGDPSLGTVGGFSIANGHGPYTLASGDSIHLIVAEGAAGLSRDECASVGRRFKSGTISAHAKNDSVFTGRDSLFLTFRRALANFHSNWNIPQPPLPPKRLAIDNATGRIRLSWELFEGSGPSVQSFRIYRSLGGPYAPDSLIHVAGAVEMRRKPLLSEEWMGEVFVVLGASIPHTPHSVT